MSLKHAIEFDVYQSSVDGVPVVHIDTPGLLENKHGPVCRIYINDDIDYPIWNNSKESIPVDSYECRRCKEWSHYEAANGRRRLPGYCPYCGVAQLRWKTDQNWELREKM